MEDPFRGKRTIVQFVPFSLEPPLHGGKIRSKEIQKALKSEFSVTTITFAWGPKDEFRDFSITLDRRHLLKFKFHQILEDLAINPVILSSESLFERIVFSTKNISPSIIWIEHPYIWPVLKKIIDRAELGHLPLIYSSHNIEWPMKADIYSKSMPLELSKFYTNEVQKLELDLIRTADGIVSVTAQDSEYLNQVCTCPVYVLSNGTYDRQTPFYRPNLDVLGKYFLFVASAHPPNVDGIYSIVRLISHVDKSLIAPIQVVGTACWSISTDSRFSHPDFESRLKLLGPVSANQLSNYIDESRGLIAPLWSGGGSNLKTAEAIYSNKLAILSKHSCAGFEEYVSEPGVLVADNPKDFVAFMLKADIEHYYVRSLRVSKLTWNAIFSSLPHIVRKIEYQKKAAL